MSDTQPTPARRTSAVLKEKQESENRLWTAVCVLILLVLLVGTAIVTYERSNQRDIATEINLGFQRGAVDCLSVIVDSKRDFQLPPYCRRPEVIVYYPPEVCDEFLRRSDECSREWDGG